MFFFDFFPGPGGQKTATSPKRKTKIGSNRSAFDEIRPVGTGTIFFLCPFLGPLTQTRSGVGGPNFACGTALHRVNFYPGAGSLRAPIPEIQNCGPPACLLYLLKSGGHTLHPNPVL